MKSESVLFHYAASEYDADQLYATGFFVPDAFVWWKHRQKTNAAFTPLEVDRAKKQAKVDCVWAIEDFLKESGSPKTSDELIIAIARRFKIRSITVPSQFPSGLMRTLEKKGLKVKIKEGPLFPERELKSKREVQALSKALRITEAGLARGIEVLKACRVNSQKRLVWSGSFLTSETLRGEIDSAIVRLGGLSAHTIVAGGAQACDPHERGSGILKAGEAIIVDIFPRDSQTGYFGDLTRTFVKGRPSDALLRLYSTVQEGKRWAIQQMKPGVDGIKIHKVLVERFTKAGYPTVRKNGRWSGFFHGTGHGLGLEVHESPRFGSTRFTPGQVITVEPGLYIPGLGGVRLEDVVHVTQRGVNNLTQAPEFFEI